MSRADRLLRGYRAWEAKAFPTSHIPGWVVLVFLFGPPCLFPLLPKSDLTVPLFCTFWLMIASGATGVFLLDRARATAPTSGGERMVRNAARVVMVGLGIAGAAAGVTVLLQTVLLSWVRTMPISSIAIPALAGSTVLCFGVMLAYRACGKAFFMDRHGRHGA